MIDLYKFAQLLDVDDPHARVMTVYAFLEECATRIKNELGSYEAHIEKDDYDFSRIKKHPEFGIRLQKLYQDHGFNDILSVFEWIKGNALFHLHRRELFNELCRSIRFARDRNTTIIDAAQQIRMIPNNQRRYSHYKKLSSRAVLSKGLEFDCVAIDCSEQYTASEMYVAMTRAMKMIYFITDAPSIRLSPPQGLSD